MRSNGRTVSRAVVAGVLGLAYFGVFSCGDGGKAPSPFQPDGEAGEGGTPSAMPGGNTSRPPPGPDPQLGGPCADDEQCEDGLDCTDDTCDRVLGRCRFSPVHARCEDDIYCDGAEQCEPGVGCREGEPVACSDSTTCTIDRCIEVTRSCENLPRDADGDGDGVWNCSGGTDCDDTDPRVNGNALEVCTNGRDDDCDGEQDERDCASPEYDSCAEPLIVEDSGTYVLSLASASEDLPLSCASSGGMRRDVVIALVVPDGPPVDVDVTAVSERAEVTLAAFADCSDPSSELSCVQGATRGLGSGSIARTILRDLAPGNYPLVLSGVSDESVSVTVSYGTALPVPTNETCGTALPLVPGKNVEVTLADTALDVDTRCVQPVGDVVFRFELEQARDVALSVAPLDARAEPIVSLRDARCARAAAELTCRWGAPSVLFARALPAGTYYASVGATAAVDVDVLLELAPPTAPPEGEGCSLATPLIVGVTEEVLLSRRADAVESGCMVGAADASFALEVDVPSDVLLVQRISAADAGAVTLLDNGCAPDSVLACGTSGQSPVRARAFGVRPGEYRAIAESRLGSPITLTALSRPATPVTLVSLSDSCEDAIRVDERGGRFKGNTKNASADFEASCDFGGARPGGGADQMLQLTLSEPRRVVLDMEESAYDTLLVVRKGPGCPGSEVMNACAPGYGASRSFLDLVLEPGEYWIQIDGFDGEAGSWVLDVFTAAP